MSQEGASRQAVRRCGSRRRTLDERLAVRVPAILRLVGQAFQRLPARSRLRRALVERRMRQVYGAFNRGDMEVFLVLSSHPAVEVHTAKDQTGVPLGGDLDEVYYGHHGLAAFAQQWLEAWEDYRVEAEEVIDCGDKLVVFLRHRGRGRESKVEIEQPFAQVVHLHKGQAVRIDTLWDRVQALRAVGLPRAAVEDPLPRRGRRR